MATQDSYVAQMLFSPRRHLISCFCDECMRLRWEQPNALDEWPEPDWDQIEADEIEIERGYENE
jgi:hypothetical protein